jgi:hypothetical protein
MEDCVCIVCCIYQLMLEHEGSMLLPNLARWGILELLKLSTHSLHPSSSPFLTPSLPACPRWMPEAPLVAGSAPWMYKGHIYSKDDMLSPLIYLDDIWLQQFEKNCTSIKLLVFCGAASTVPALHSS